MPPLRLACSADRLACSAAGCGRVTDSEQVRLCRAIMPVLQRRRRRDPRDPRRPRPISAAPACASTMRRARAGPSGASTFVACGFAGADLRARPARSRRRSRPMSGRLGEARLLFLKRFLAEAAGQSGAAAAAGETRPTFSAVRRLRAAAADQRDRARGDLRAARDRLFADLRPRRADQSCVRRDRGARRLWGDRRRSRRPSRSASAIRSAGLALALAIAAALAGGWSLVVGRVVVAPLHARHRLGQPILIATAAVALTHQ